MGTRVECDVNLQELPSFEAGRFVSFSQLNRLVGTINGIVSRLNDLAGKIEQIQGAQAADAELLVVPTSIALISGPAGANENQPTYPLKILLRSTNGGEEEITSACAVKVTDDSKDVLGIEACDRLRPIRSGLAFLSVCHGREEFPPVKVEVRALNLDAWELKSVVLKNNTLEPDPHHPVQAGMRSIFDKGVFRELPDVRHESVPVPAVGISEVLIPDQCDPNGLYQMVMLFLCREEQTEAFLSLYGKDGVLLREESIHVLGSRERHTFQEALFIWSGKAAAAKIRGATVLAVGEMKRKGAS